MIQTICLQRNRTVLLVARDSNNQVVPSYHIADLGRRADNSAQISVSVVHGNKESPVKFRLTEKRS